MVLPVCHLIYVNWTGKRERERMGHLFGTAVSLERPRTPFATGNSAKQGSLFDSKGETLLFLKAKKRPRADQFASWLDLLFGLAIAASWQSHRTRIPVKTVFQRLRSRAHRSDVRLRGRKQSLSLINCSAPDWPEPPEGSSHIQWNQSLLTAAAPCPHLRVSG